MNGLHLYNALGGNDQAVTDTPGQTAQHPFKMLISFHYYKNVDLASFLDQFPSRPMVFGDSGAYSAYSQGAEVKVADYAAWLKTWGDLLTTYVNLDVIRDPSGTAANQRHLENAGLRPIPVFHTGTDMKVLRDLIKHYGYIALGGMVGVPGPHALKWCATCFKEARGNDVVYHGFGQTRNDVIQQLPWFSVDSSSWGAGHRFGQIPVWDRRKLTKVKVGDRTNIYKVARHIRDLGGDPEWFADRNQYHRSKAITVSAASWREFELFLRRKHGEVPLPDRAHAFHRRNTPGTDTRMPGPNVYLAEGSGDNLRIAAQAVHKQANRGGPT